MISASLASARAIAAREQRYAGVRFQYKYQEDGKGCQYMIFIVHDPQMNPSDIIANGFRAVEGIEPIKLPDSVGVMEVVNSDGEIDDTPSGELTDKTSFSIIFSPSGKLVIHLVRVINKEGKRYSDDSKDDVFNSESKVKDRIAMFVQDTYFSINGLDEEPSRNSFRIYDKTVFEKLNPLSRYNDYLRNLEVVYINPYTGTMINK